MKLYNIIVFFEDKSPVKYHKVSNIDKLNIWLQKYKPTAKYMNVYDKYTKEFINQIKINRGQ
jgi:hypothetical protein